MIKVGGKVRIFKYRVIGFLQGLLLRLLSMDFFRYSKIVNYFLKYYKRRGYRGVKDNLSNLGYSEKQAKEIANKESYVYIKRILDLYRYPNYYKSMSKTALRQTVTVTGDAAAIDEAINGKDSIIFLIHSGYYWEAVLALAIKSDIEQEYIFLIYSKTFNRLMVSLTDLEMHCPKIKVVDLDDRRKSVLAIAKGLRKGSKLIIFSDLPPSIGSMFFGDPEFGIFMGRKASIAGGPVKLAQLFKKDVFYFTHELSEDGNSNNTRFIRKVKSKDISVQTNFDIIEGVVKQRPHEWAYLDRVENYFHLQIRKDELLKR